MKEKPALDAFLGIKSLASATELYKQLGRPIFLLKDADITYRTVLDWDRKGLLENSRAQSEWRRYDYVQFVWIKLINELRSFGVPIPIIQKIRTEIFVKFNLKWLFEAFSLNPELLNNLPDDESKQELLDFISSIEYERLDENASVSLLQLLVGETLTSKIPVSLVVFADGHVITLFENPHSLLEPADITKMTYETFVKVSVTNIIKTFLSDSKDSFLTPQLAILPANEKKLLEIIHSGEYEKVTINYRDKKIKSLELVKEQEVKRRIVDILQEGKYQDIVIKSHKGSVTKIQNTIKLIMD